MSEALSQQERLQAIAEKRKRQTEIENKRRQLEDDRRQLQHLKSKALRERWLLDGAPSAGPEEDEAKKQLQEDEAKTKGLEESILRLEQELEELETGVSATSTKESLTDAAKEEEAKTGDIKNPAGSVKVVKVHNSPRQDKSGGASDMMKAVTLLSDLSAPAVVHEVRGADGTMENGVHPLSSTEVDELIHKADEATVGEGTPKGAIDAAGTPKKEITGMEAKPGSDNPPAAGGEASAEHPVTMVFMGYENVDDEAETKKVLGLEGTVKAELVVIEDGETKGVVEGAKEDQAPPNGSAADPVKGQEGAGEKGEPDGGAAELNTKEKQPCKCCSVIQHSAQLSSGEVPTTAGPVALLDVKVFSLLTGK
ncbi:hypothetical protein JZ751_024673 [Albula glossodonta]|uniref:Paralemmin-1 n=1 Tax=Albula glossodonta TaxID=121402 RepID=A0A8T2PE07_9TELE|nr:hypothetical protein JZ751_024673 [Albula glossodonta]